MSFRLLKPVPTGLFALALATASIASTKAEAVSVLVTYDGITVQTDDGGPRDQLIEANAVEYEEGVSATIPAFAVFDRLVLQGSVNKPRTRINLEAELDFPFDSTATTDLRLLVSDVDFTLPIVPWLAESDFASIIGKTSASYAAYWDPGNTLFATTNLVDSEMLSQTDSYSSITSIPGPSSPFSMTLEVIFRQADLGSVNREQLAIASQSIAAVPLPAAGWLMIGGLGALMAMRRRKARCA